MRPTLILNLAILVANFALSYGANETQIRVMRTTSRTVLSPPHPLATTRGHAASDARLVKYLARLPGAERLTPAQVKAVCGSLDRCRAVLATAAAKMRRQGLDPSETVGFADGLRAAVARTLEAARIEDGLRARLVQIVLSSTG